MTILQRVQTAFAEAPRSDLVGALLYTIVALVLSVLAACGFTSAPWLATAAVAYVLLVCAAAFLMRSRRSAQAVKRWSVARPFVVLLAVPTGFYLLESLWSKQFFGMDPHYAGLNLCVLGAVFAIVYLAGQRTRGAIVAFLLACALAGIANRFVVQFKGQPIVPADLFALSTAAQVSSGYVYEFDEIVLGTVAMIAIAITVVAYLPKLASPTPPRIVANSVLALALATCFGW